MTRRTAGWIWIICAALNFASAALYLWPEPIMLFFINARAGCWPWSPSDVEFHQGMTICPDQRAHGFIELPPPSKHAPAGPLYYHPAASPKGI